MPVIELTNVVAGYGDFLALNGVSCDFPEGATGLLGPNGAGKSTLLKTLLGFNRATSGTVGVLGFELPRQALEVRQRIGYMPEYEVMSPKTSAVGFLTYCGQLFGMSRVDAMERTHEVLNYVGLGESRYRKMETYSTGMLQRAKLGQALVHDPKLLLLDEPTNGLDPEGRIEMLNLILEIAARPGVSVVLSSHLLPDVQHVCSHVIMMEKGHVVREGSMEELTSVRAFLYEVRVRDNAHAFWDALRAKGYGCSVRDSDLALVHCNEQLTEQGIFATARECETQVRHFGAAHSRLEEAFMRAVGQEPGHERSAESDAAVPANV